MLFDSIKEAKYYDELFLKLRTGKITNLKLQEKFDLIPTLKWEGKTLKKIIYKTDFTYEENGIKYVVDVKGFKTDVYNIGYFCIKTFSN